MIKQYLKYFLFCFICVFLLANLAQDYLKLNWQQKPLKGFFVNAPQDTLSTEKWFDGSYAEKTNAYLNEAFGFRNFYVRLCNQIRFNLFNQAKVRDFFMGRENFMYQQGYLGEFNGVNYQGQIAVNDTVQKLKWLDEKLRSLGKTLLVVLAPSKARIYPEYLPEKLKHGPTDSCHYFAYKKALNAYGINVIDFNSWYLQKKKSSPYLLIPQTGVHWSRLEAVRAADTIFRRLGALSGQTVPGVVAENIIVKDSLEPPDDDAISSINLLRWPRFEKMAYPQQVKVGGPKSNVGVLVISDSYWWDIYERRLPAAAFSHNEFWYYCREMFGSKYLGMTAVESMDMQRHILQHDCVLIICAESNLGTFGFGFISKALNALRNPLIPSQQEIEEYKNVILKNADWMTHLRDKATRKKVPLDTVIMQDVIWSLQTKGPLLKEPTVDDAVRRIMSDREWLQQIKTEAAQKGLNMDTLVRRNAEYVIESRK